MNNREIKAWAVCPKEGKWDDYMSVNIYNLLFRRKKDAIEYIERAKANVVEINFKIIECKIIL